MRLEDMERYPVLVSGFLIMGRRADLVFTLNLVGVVTIAS